MAKAPTRMKPRAAPKAAPEAPPRAAPKADAGDRVVEWVLANKTKLTLLGVALAVVAGGIWFAFSYRNRLETFAARELNQARGAVESGNLPLAASDLGRIVATYGSTSAGEEAAILLARVHLGQNQAELAVGEMRTFLAGGPRAQFVGPANGLLGSALENLGRYGEAATAYGAAADASPYDLIKTQFLMDQGRAASLAGDSAQAAAAYQRVIDEVEDTNAQVEARIRLAEIERSASRN